MYCLRIGVLGISHKTAGIELLEAIAKGAQSLADKRGFFFRFPSVLLSTCNRTEIYFSAEDLAEAHSELLAYLRAQIEGAFEHRLYSYFCIECFAHLCRVTAGLDSAIFAETEIQRQVKLAYSRASALFPLTASQHFAFQKALKVGKLVRSRLSFEQTPTLFGTIWQMGEKWASKRILLVGNSEINRGFASFLLHKGVRNFSFCSQNKESVRIEGVELFDRGILSHWQQFDIIICASKSENYLITGQGNGNCLIFDLSIPRNVDPEVGDSALLYNIEQLHQIIEQGQKKERRDKWNAIVTENVIRLARIYHFKTQRVQESVEMGSHL